MDLSPEIHVIADGLAAIAVDRGVRKPTKRTSRSRPQRGTRTDDEHIVDLVAAELRAGRLSPEQIPERLVSAMEKVTPASAARVAAQIRRTSRKHLREMDGMRSAFETHIREQWGEAIDALALLTSIFREFGNQLFIEGLEEKRLREPTFRSLADLHARACRVATEIICLLSSGLADGAQARWRTLHEIAVVSILLSVHGEEMARRYLYHGYIKMFKAADEYQRACVTLGGKRISARRMNMLRRRRDRARARFGKDFATSDWGWATGLNGNPRPTFRHLEEACALESLRPFFMSASDDVHGGPLGLQPSGVELHGRGFLLAGGSDAGLAEPGMNAATSLTQVAWSRLHAAPSLRHLVTVETIGILQEDCTQAFVRCHLAVRRRTEKELAKRRRRRRRAGRRTARTLAR